MAAVDQDQADDGCRRGRPVLRVGQGGLFRKRGWERDCQVGGWQGGADRDRGIGFRSTPKLSEDGLGSGKAEQGKVGRAQRGKVVSFRVKEFSGGTSVKGL
jgi:hypothetical protein